MAKCYSDENQAILFKGLASIKPKLFELQLALHSITLNVPAAREYAQHGIARRLSTLGRCIEKIFEILPPDLDGIPDKDAVNDATIFLQAFIANTFGVLDNLAHVWAKETDLREVGGEPLSRMKIGLHKKHKRLRSTFSNKMQMSLSEPKQEAWFENLIDYRDALAHRIPLYIPPNCYTRKHESRYLAINTEISIATGTRDFETIKRLEQEQKMLIHFEPSYTHSPYEEVESRKIHEQILCDFLTVEELVHMFVCDLTDRNQTT